MKKDKFKTKVVFLIEQPIQDITCAVFAIFPELKERDESFMLCYSHIGQHSTSHIEYTKGCKPATEKEYQELKKELEETGYNLEIVSNF